MCLAGRLGTVVGQHRCWVLWLCQMCALVIKCEAFAGLLWHPAHVRGLGLYLCCGELCCRLLNLGLL